MKGKEARHKKNPSIELRANENNDDDDLSLATFFFFIILGEIE